MLAQRNFFGFHSSCFFLSLLFILVFHVDEKVSFLPEELKGRKNVYSIMRLPAGRRKLWKSETKSEWWRKSRATRRRKKRNYPVNKLWTVTRCVVNETTVMTIQGLLLQQVAIFKNLCFRALFGEIYFSSRLQRFPVEWKYHGFKSNLNPRTRYLERDVLLPAVSFQRQFWASKCSRRKNVANFCLEILFSIFWDSFMWNGADRVGGGISETGFQDLIVLKWLSTSSRENFATTCCFNGWTQYSRSRMKFGAIRGGDLWL